MRAWHFAIGLSILAGIGCGAERVATEPPPPERDPARALIARAIEAHGLRRDEPTEIRFDFRGTPYRLVVGGPQRIYERTTATEQGTRVERLEGERFSSSLAGVEEALSEHEIGRGRRSLNSVAYFTLLPLPLEDPAVIARSLGSTTLGGRPYDTLEVRFRAEGGGEDHEDVFRYWLDPETHRIAYVAYRFATGAGGVRLRRASAQHEVSGVVLLDYDNHGLDGADATIDEAVRAYEAGELPLVSRVELRDVRVQP